MKSYIPDTFWSFSRSLATCLTAVGLLAGCGSGLTADSGSGSGVIIGGIGTGGTGVIKSSSYQAPANSGLIAAVIFLDKNGNRLPDPGEPAAVTDQNGGYSLQLEPVDAAAYPLLIMAVAGETIVSATGQIVTTSYVAELGAPPGGQ